MSTRKMNSLVNRRFGYLVVTAVIPNTSDCRTHCNACGKNEVRTKKSLYRLKSCGCQRGKLISIGKTKHGHKRKDHPSPEYVAYLGIHRRCDNPNNPDYPAYGGSGLKVCSHWSGKNGFIRFLADMGFKPQPKHLYSIDRIDNAKGYLCKRCAGRQQCRWATAHVQRMNQRRMQKAA